MKIIQSCPIGIAQLHHFLCTEVKLPLTFYSFSSLMKFWILCMIDLGTGVLLKLISIRAYIYICCFCPLNLKLLSSSYSERYLGISLRENLYFNFPVPLSNISGLVLKSTSCFKYTTKRGKKKAQNYGIVIS